VTEESGSSLPGQSGPYSKTLSQKTKKTTAKAVFSYSKIIFMAQFSYLLSHDKGYNILASFNIPLFQVRGLLISCEMVL
jgi:hypothetical protein